MYTTIDLADLQDLLNKQVPIHLLDVREPDEFTAKHIACAKNYPLSQIDSWANQLDKSCHYHIICKTGGRSKKASDKLASLGFQLTNLSKGMDDWH